MNEKDEETQSEDVDYSKRKGISDEPHWIDFVQSVGGKLVEPMKFKDGIKNADFLFGDANVIAELKILETEFAHTAQVQSKIQSLMDAHPEGDPTDPNTVLGRKVINVLREPLKRIIKKANRQIKETKAELKISEASGILICVNDNFRGLPPGVVMALISDVLSGPSYRSVTAVIYQTNHYVELAEVPYAVLLWSPLYSEGASSELVNFINDLGRKWRVYSERIDGPYDISEEREGFDLESAAVVTGIYRQREFKS